MPRITYDSNNSGGRWWLTDQQWKDLEAAGWTVHWYKDEDPTRPFSLRTSTDGRWLGALAGSASKDFQTMRDAIEEWERITGESSTDLGCYSCCGPPHSFSDGVGEYYSPEPIGGMPYGG